MFARSLFQTFSLGAPQIVNRRQQALLSSAGKNAAKTVVVAEGESVKNASHAHEHHHLHAVKNREELDGSFEALVQAGGVRKVPMGRPEAGFAKLANRLLGANTYYLKIRLTEKTPQLAKSKVEKTLRDLQHLHPPLRCRVLKQGSQLKQYFYEENVDTKISVEIRSRAGGDGSFREIFKNELQRETLQFGQDANKVFILQNEGAGHQDLVFGVHHFFNDGTSTTTLAHEFMQLYSGQKTVADFPPATWDAPSDVRFKRELNPTNDWKEDLKIKLKCASSLVQVLNRTITGGHSNLPPSTQAKRIKDSQIPSKCISSNYVTTLSEEVTAALKHSCRKHHATFTFAVAEAYARAIGEKIEQSKNDTKTPLKLFVTITGNARQLVTPHLPERSLTPFVYQGIMFTEPSNFTNRTEPPYKLARWLKHEMKQSEKNGPVSSMTVESLLDFLPSTAFNPTLGLSSWGSRLPIKRHYGEYEVDDVELFMNFNFLAFPMLQMYPADPETKRLRITLFGITPFFDDAMLESVSQRAGDILKEMSQT